MVARRLFISLNGVSMHVVSAVACVEGTQA